MCAGPCVGPLNSSSRAIPESASCTIAAQWPGALHTGVTLLGLFLLLRDEHVRDLDVFR